MVQQAEFGRAISSWTRSGESPKAARIIEPTSATMHRPTDEDSSRERCDIINDALSPSHTMTTCVSTSTAPRRSGSTQRASQNNSRPNSPLTNVSSPSTFTSTSAAGFEQNNDLNAIRPPRRPSLLNRLKSTVSTFSAVDPVPRRPSISPSDFRKTPEDPEKHFIDSVGMVIPGVCDRNACSHPVSHFIVNWRLSEPTEYTTSLADHGITYSDYCRIIAALADFLDELPDEPRPKPQKARQWWSLKAHDTADNESIDLLESRPSQKHNGRRKSLESVEQFRKTEQHALELNELLADITSNWRARGLPVLVCIGSFSLFAPDRISEAIVQILHVSLENQPLLAVRPTRTPGQRLSLVDLNHPQEAEDHSVSVSRPKVNYNPPPPGGPVIHCSQPHLRNRTRPWPLWPNAIPTAKRGLLDAHAERYGADPYFRAFMRANVNSRTTSTSYAKFMIEKEDDPFVNKRLDYKESPSKAILLWKMLTKGFKDAKIEDLVNRDRYEHNRKLECRKTVEHGSRLRMVRFGFRHPLYPPHTPEMTELGLDKAKYEQILRDIDDIRRNEKSIECAPRFMFGSVNPIARSAEDALMKVSEYIRKLNASQGKVIWTIEKIPCVYDHLLGSGKEWEISVWNGEDPLALLLQLEKWGIIEKKLDIDEDED